MAASYPGSAKTFTARNNGDIIQATHVGDLQDEVNAIETGLLNSLSHDLKFTDNTFDIGKSGATRPRDLFLSRNADVGGTLAITGTSTFTGAATFSSGDNSFKVGASTETHKGSGCIDTDSTQAGTIANTSETVLRTYTLPANALNANGRVLRFHAWGSFGGNANTKTVRCRLGGLSGTVVSVHSSTSNGIKWVIVVTIIRTGSNTQDWYSFLPASAASQDINANFGTDTQADSSAIDIVVTGQNGTASANDIVYHGSMVEFLS